MRQEDRDYPELLGQPSPKIQAVLEHCEIPPWQQHALPQPAHHQSVLKGYPWRLLNLDYHICSNWCRLMQTEVASTVRLDFRKRHCDLGGDNLFCALTHCCVSRCKVSPQQLRKLLHDFGNDSSVIGARHAGHMLWMAWSRKPKQQRPEAFAPGAVVNSLFRKPYRLTLPTSTRKYHFIIESQFFSFTCSPRFITNSLA